MHRLRRRPAAAPSSQRTCTGAATAESATLTEADSALVDRVLPSPNFGDRRGRGIDALILHYTGMASGKAALARLLDAAAEVSAHYLVWEDGRIDQLVAEADRAWHAGLSFWAGEQDMNAVSVGIEIVNGGHAFGLPPYPPAQIDAVVALCTDICRRRRIAPARVLGHSDIAPSRKEDPGELFPWPALARAGVALMIAAPSARTASGDELRKALSAIGYDGTDESAAIAAFQRRWRPACIDGRADAETAALILAVAANRGISSHEA